MLFLALVCQLLVALNVHAEVDASPESQQAHAPDTDVFMCDSTTPLTGCHVRVSSPFHRGFDKLLDLADGPQSPSFVLDYDYNTSYAGVGLANGDCGIRLNVTSYFFVECFGRHSDGKVSRRFGQMTNDGNTGVHLSSLTPSLVTVAPGSSLNLLYKADRKIIACHVAPPTSGLAYAQDYGPPADPRYLPHGAGTWSKECGLQVTDMQAEDAGIWSTTLWYNSTPATRSSRITVVLVQAVPVGDPVLEIKDEQSLAPGMVLEATCVTPSAVPHGSLTWLLDGHVVRQDNLNDTTPGDVGKSRPWQPQPLHQTFRRLLTAGDSGKRLECRMEHVALAGPRTVGHELIVPSQQKSD